MKHHRGIQKSLTDYLLRTREKYSIMSQDYADSLLASPTPLSSHKQLPASTDTTKNCDYTPLTKEVLETSLEAMYTKLAPTFHFRLHTTTNTLTQELAVLGWHTDILERKHDELSIAYSKLSREHESLVTIFAQI